MTDTVATAEKPPEGGKARKRKTDPNPAGISLSQVEKPTELEKFTRRRATQALREALAVHQPVVKKCVALRLCQHKSYEDLARELYLTTEQVTDILRRMRPWVRRFTTFFEGDWFWVDGVAPELSFGKRK